RRRRIRVLAHRREEEERSAVRIGHEREPPHTRNVRRRPMQLPAHQIVAGSTATPKMPTDGAVRDASDPDSATGKMMMRRSRDCALPRPGTFSPCQRRRLHAYTPTTNAAKFRQSYHSIPVGCQYPVYPTPVGADAGVDPVSELASASLAKR